MFSRPAIPLILIDQPDGDDGTDATPVGSRMIKRPVRYRNRRGEWVVGGTRIWTPVNTRPSDSQFKLMEHLIKAVQEERSGIADSPANSGGCLL